MSNAFKRLENFSSTTLSTYVYFIYIILLTNSCIKTFENTFNDFKIKANKVFICLFRNSLIFKDFSFKL